MGRRIVPVLMLGLLLVSGCGGQNGRSMLPGPVGPTSREQVTVQFRLTLPTSRERSPKYISASTAFARITVSSPGTGSLPPVIIMCDKTSIPAACSGTIQAPIGTDTFLVQLDDQAGAILSSGTTVQNIVEGLANFVQVAFNGVVKSIELCAPEALITGVPMSTPLALTAKDADGNTIIGTFDNPIALTVSGDSSNSITLTKSVVGASTDAVRMAYSGSAGFISAAIGAAAKGASPSPLLTVRGTARVMTFLGDSITWGGYNSAQPFPVQIGYQLSITTQNLGTPSIRIAGALASEVPAVSSNATDAVVYLGTNDLMALVQNSETLTGVESDFSSIINELRTKGARVYILTVRDYTMDPNWNPQGTTSAQIQAAHDVARALDDWMVTLPNVAVLDVRNVSAMMDPASYEDGIHLNASGTSIFADSIARFTQLRP